MTNYLGINDIENISELIEVARLIKKNPLAHKELGTDKTLLMVFFNPSLRTRLSTERAARNLGMDVMTFEANQGWQLEFGKNTIMNGQSAEHVVEAAKVMSEYADILAVRAFPELKDKFEDELDYRLNGFAENAGVPLINMESAVAHPLQALADAITIEEYKTRPRPKVVLSWAPHPKALPHAVPNSFVKMMHKLDVDFVIANPDGYDLDKRITKSIPVYHNQEEALEDADFVYAKNWSSYDHYGEVLQVQDNWTINLDKLGKARFMHCLPVRRNVVVADEVLDSDQSLVIQQSANRLFAAQAVLKQILSNQA